MLKWSGLIYGTPSLQSQITNKRGNIMLESLQKSLQTLLVKTYSGTGRPNQFILVNENNQERIDSLTQSFGWSICLEALSEEYTIDNAWKSLTYIDSGGFVQWKLYP